MDSNNWPSSQADPPPMEVSGVDWRTTLQADSRSRIVNKIMDTLKRHLPSSGQEGVQELKKIAMRFEEKIYHAATSQSDYLRRISLKMLTMESKSSGSGPIPNAMPSNSAGMSRNPQDPASQSMQPQGQNQGQSLPIPMASNPQTVQGRPQLLAQNIRSNISTGGVQSSPSLPSALPSVNGLAKNNMPNVMQNSNMQNMPGVSQNSMGNSMVQQGVASNIYTNSQKQQMVQGRQNMQQLGSQQQTQQSQNQQQYMYQQQQLQQQQQQILKQKLQQGGIQQPILQTQMQQQQQQQQHTQQSNLLSSAQLQSSQQSVMQNPSVMQQQPSMVSAMQQNMSSSMQQSSQSSLQQHQQSVLRQQQQAPAHHQQTQMSQQSMLQSQQQQQHLMAQQTNIPDIPQQQPQRLMGQQNSIASMSGQQQTNQNLQQQQLMGQQGNHPNMHQQQLGSQNHAGTLPQQQQQQLLGSQSGNSSMQTSQHPGHMLQQSKVLAQQQNPNGSALWQGGSQQPQQQQMMPQMQSQSAQLQQQMGLQQQSNSVQHNMQQRLQSSNALLQQQNVIDPQKMFQSQRTPTEAAPSTSLDSTAQTGSTEAQEEVYQKLKAMKDMYLTEVEDVYKKICLKLQQNDSLPQQPKSEGVEKLKYFKQMLERVLNYLQLPKINTLQITKERVAQLEKQIISVVSSHRPRKPGPPLQQGQIPPSHLQSLQQNQQSHSQIPQTQSHESGGQLQNVQGSSVPSMQPGDMTGLHGPVSSLSGITTSQQSMMNSLQPGSNLDSGQGNAPNSIQQVAVQNPVSAPQQASAQTGVNMLQSTMNSLQPNSNMLQSQHIKQEQQLKQQFQQRQHMQQQMLHKQQLYQQQQQQLHLQQLKQQPGQMQGHQMPQIHQMNDVNDIKLRQSMGLKPGLLPQHLSQGQRYSHQQLKPGVSFPNSSPQMLQAGSPQINQHSSPQIEQPNILPPLNKAGTPLQSANSPFLPTMSPLAPSPMPGDPEKPNSATSNAANILQLQSTGAPASTSLAIGTPGISASPLLADSSPPDGHGTTLTTLPGKAGVTDQPFERLLKVVKSMSSKALNASVGDIVSVVSMIDRIAGSAPGNGSRAAVGEDLVAMTKCRLQARNFITQDGSSGMKRMRRYTSAMPLNVASSVGSPNNSFKQLTGPETSEVESTATSSAKRPRIEVNPTLTEELKEINEHLIDTVVAFSDEDVDPTLSAVAAEGGEGTIVKCTYSAVSLSPNLKSQYCSAQMSPIQPLRLLVPTNYPNCSPILLDKLPVEVSKEYDDLSVKVKSRFSISLRALSQPISIRDIARTWDDCARTVITEYAHQSGGGTFSSKYGTWENCLTAT